MRPGEAFRAVTRTACERTIVTVHGELDIAPSPLLQEVIDKALVVGTPRIDSDFSHVTFRGCAGLAVLLRARARARADARARGICLSVSEPPVCTVVPAMRTAL
ncbi:STAS domain-containing protein [Streptomyces sp. NPDC053429]|uniref:STAS domain-containing protein n=1 Tax=Streptomyces sp. NPDC053429 TaxID=3365702 RepID=UPI0037D3D2B5